MTIRIDKLKIQINILVPSTPNYLRDTNGQVIKIEDIPQKDLRKIAKLWTEEFIAKGKK